MRGADRRPAGPVAGLALAALSLAAGADGPPAVTLEVAVHGLGSDSGAVAFALYDSEASYDQSGSPLRSGFVDIHARRSRWVVPELPAGVYAVKVFHDSNDNRELDLGTFGIPKEPYGFSNDARGSFGPPGFEAVRFRVEKHPTAIEIRVD